MGSSSKTSSSNLGSATGSKIRRIRSQFKNPDAKVKLVLHTYVLPYIFNMTSIYMLGEGGGYYSRQKKVGICASDTTVWATGVPPTRPDIPAVGSEMVRLVAAFPWAFLLISPMEMENSALWSTADVWLLPTGSLQRLASAPMSRSAPPADSFSILGSWSFLSSFLSPPLSRL
jgi:hypothetical protein